MRVTLPTLVGLLATAAVPQVAGVAAAQDSSSFDLPEELNLTGVVRDFRERSVEGGHPDFERRPSSNFGHYYRIAGPELDEDGKPAFFSKGFKRSREWVDIRGNKIMPPLDHYPALSSDLAGRMGTSEGGAVYSKESFEQWFRDIPGVNVSKPLTIKLKRKAGTNIYSFDDRKDDSFADKGGFFPINGELYGNSRNNDKNFHFTFELDTEFVYVEGSDQTFTFRGDDDVFVYVDGKQVIDIGGVHSAIEQTVNLDRLEWLEDGRTYQLKFFFAERHRTQSNFRIETSINLRTADLPTTTALHD